MVAGYVDFVAGCVGGTAGVLAGHPFDTIKVQLQCASHGKYRGTFDCFRQIVKEGGYRSLYKGMSSPLAGLAFINAIGFGVYGNVLKRFERRDSMLAHFVAGAVAGVAQSAVNSPVELAKLRAQLSHNGVSSLTAATRTVKRDGFRGLYKGLSLTIIRDCPAVGCYFASYEYLVRRLSADGKPESLTMPQLLAAGGLAGMFSWAVNYPTDVIKTRFQADGANGKHIYTGIKHCIKMTYAEQGVRTFFHGLGSAMVRAFPTNAATFFAAEWTYRIYETYINPPERESYTAVTVEDQFRAKPIYDAKSWRARKLMQMLLPEGDGQRHDSYADDSGGAPTADVHNEFAVINYGAPFLM